MTMTAQGRLHAVLDTKQITERFQKREFVLEMTDNPQYPQHVAFELTGYGYGGAIKVLVGLSPAGEVLGARVLAHAETPGLGDKIEAAKADWIFDFDGRSLASLPKEDWALKRDGGVFDQFSGASITPRAVVTTVRRALELFGRNRAALTAPLTPEEKAPGAAGEESGS